MRAAGKVIVITGSSSGIGAAAARQLAERGAIVCVLARRAEQLAKIVDDITARGGTAFAYAADLTDDDSTTTAVDQIFKDHGHVDVLINNAGRSIRRPIKESFDRLHDHERVMAANYFGAIRITNRILPAMLERRRGHVVFSSTMSTQLPIPLFSAYLASKSALESYARSLSAELGSEGISSTIVYFPMVRTEMSGATDIYSAMKMMSADDAGSWLVKAALQKPSRVTSWTGAVSQAGMSVLPGAITKITTPLFQRMDRNLARKSQG